MFFAIFQAMSFLTITTVGKCNTFCSYFLKNINLLVELFCGFQAIPAICLTIGSCWFFICFVKDIANDVEWLNSSGKGMEISRRVEVKKRFCSIVRDYSEIKQLSRMSHIVSMHKITTFLLYLDESESTIRFMCTKLFSYFFGPYCPYP